MSGQGQASAVEPNWSGKRLAFATALLAGLNALYFAQTRVLSAIFELLTTSHRHYSVSTHFELEVAPRVLVAIPLVSLLGSLILAGFWVIRRGQMSASLKLVWVWLLAGIVLGWPVALGCLLIKGIGESGGMMRSGDCISPGAG